MNRKNSENLCFLRVGCAPVDGEHRSLFDQLTIIDRMVAGGSPYADFLPAIETFIEKMADHFAHEEDMLAMAGAPDLEAHINTHRQLLQNLRFYVEQIKVDEQVSVDTTTIDVLKQWFANHLEKDRLTFAKFTPRQNLECSLPTEAE